MRVKRHLRGAIDRGARSIGLLALYERRMRRGLTVLMYHRVLPDAECEGYPFPSLVMPLSMFRELVRWIAAHARVAPVGEALAALDADRAPASGASRERPSVAITFDDGYADNARHAAPVLEEFGVRASFYVTTRFVETGELLWFDRALHSLGGAQAPRAGELVDEALGLARAAPGANAIAPRIEALKRIPTKERDALLARLEALAGGAHALDARRFAPMRVDDCRALARRGHEIGSHGVAHTLFVHTDDAELELELRESRSSLEAWAEKPVTGLCYPNGDSDERVVAATRAAGYAYACGTSFGRNEPGCDRWRLARIDVTRERVCDASGRFDEIAFRCELAGWHEALR